MKGGSPELDPRELETIRAMMTLVAGDRKLVFRLWSGRLRSRTKDPGASSSGCLLVYGLGPSDERLAFKHSSGWSRHRGGMVMGGEDDEEGSREKS